VITATTREIRVQDEKYTFGDWVRLQCTSCPDWGIIIGPFTEAAKLGDQVKEHEDSHGED
jgi:hypothetical protein